MHMVNKDHILIFFISFLEMDRFHFFEKTNRLVNDVENDVERLTETATVSVYL